MNLLTGKTCLQSDCFVLQREATHAAESCDEALSGLYHFRQRIGWQLESAPIENISFMLKVSAWKERKKNSTKMATAASCVRRHLWRSPLGKGKIVP